METKTCVRCGTTRPLEQFKKDPRVPSGRTGCCKECARKEDREYKGRPEVKARRSKHRRKYRDPRAFYMANPDAQKAHNLVNNAIRAGSMPKASSLTCANCGNNATEYHHHNGYDDGHEFDVIPLCRSCHRLTHSELT